jgi:hypothetical protein
MSSHETIRLFVSAGARRLAGIGLALALTGSSASADSFMQFQFSNANGTGAFSVPASPGGSWALPGSVEITDSGSGAVVATLVDATYTLTLEPEGRVQMGFTLEAGDTSDATTVVVDSPVLAFSPIDDLGIQALVGFSLTDSDESGFAQMRAVGQPGEGAFKGFYNGGVQFTQLVNRVRAESVEPGVGAGTVTASGSDPDSGYRVVGGPVSDVSVHLAMTVTPLDVLSVTSSMGVSAPVPEPSGILLGLLWTVPLLRRRA